MAKLSAHGAEIGTITKREWAQNLIAHHSHREVFELAMAAITELSGLECRESDLYRILGDMR